MFAEKFSNKMRCGILSIDTSQGVCSVSCIVIKFDKEFDNEFDNKSNAQPTAIDIYSIRSHQKYQQVAILPDLVKTILARSEMSLNDLACIIVVSGPGSFTGIRIGLGYIYGLLAILNIPVFSISSLTANAYRIASSAIEFKESRKIKSDANISGIKKTILRSSIPSIRDEIFVQDFGLIFDPDISDNYDYCIGDNCEQRISSPQISTKILTIEALRDFFVNVDCFRHKEEDNDKNGDKANKLNELYGFYGTFDQDRDDLSLYAALVVLSQLSDKRFQISDIISPIVPIKFMAKGNLQSNMSTEISQYIIKEIDCSYYIYSSNLNENIVDGNLDPIYIKPPSIN